MPSAKVEVEIAMDDNLAENTSEYDLTENREELPPKVKISDLHYDPVAMLLSGYGDNAENISMELRYVAHFPCFTFKITKNLFL